MQIFAENTNRRIDGLGRITVPKGIRDRFGIKENDKLEFYTGVQGNSQYILMAPEESTNLKYVLVADVLKELGVTNYPKELMDKVKGLEDLNKC
jgi:AbrB family looped-hinge helix DNA binding protein